MTLAVLPYERILVRARLWDSSLSDSEPDLDRGKMGWPSRPPPSRIGRTGENSAIFSGINKNPTASVCLTVRLFRCCRARLGLRRRGDSHPRAFIQYGGREKKRHDRGEPLPHSLHSPKILYAVDVNTYGVYRNNNNTISGIAFKIIRRLENKHSLSSIDRSV